MLKMVLDATRVSAEPLTDSLAERIVGVYNQIDILPSCQRPEWIMAIAWLQE